MIIVVIIVVSQLSTDSFSVSIIKSIITYCSPLSITVDLYTSFIRIITSLETYHTRIRITVPDSSSICKKHQMLQKLINLTAIHSSIIRSSISTSIITVCIKSTLKDSEVAATVTSEVIHLHR